MSGTVVHLPPRAAPANRRVYVDGDAVMLRGGGPVMTVMSWEAGVYLCAWPQRCACGEVYCRSERFPEATLALIHPEGRAP